MKIFLLKKLDTFIGDIFASIFPVPIHRNFSLLSSLFIIRPGGIGDAVLLAPSIRSLKKTCPAIHITVLAEQRNAGVFPLIPGVDRLLCYDSPCELLQVFQRSYDAVIDTEQWHRLSAVVARFVPASVKIGFDTNERRRMFTHQIPYTHDDYEAISFVHLLAPLEIEAEAVEAWVPFLSVPDAASGKAAGLLEPLHNEPFVIIFSGASIPERQWGTGRFRQVAEMLSAFGINIVVVGAKEDRQQGELIVGGGLGLNLAGLTSLSETAAVIQKSALLLSSDSGVLHIAVGLGVPTVSLFGPGKTKKWAPQGEHHIVINKELPCSPCTTFGNTPTCLHETRCMSDITVDEVVNAITMLLCQVKKYGLKNKKSLAN
jgi:ADP-heptose:LPS heptosyltransferase